VGELSERDRHTLKNTVSKDHRTAAKVTAEINIHLKTPFPRKTAPQQIHKFNIHSRTATDKPLNTENKTKR
jgi:hypothetical protein